MKQKMMFYKNTEVCDLSSTSIWRALLIHLFREHYGLEINDTPFSENDTIQSYINSGYSLLEAINTVAEKYNLIKIDFHFLSTEYSSPFIKQVDILRTCRILGMMEGKKYKSVIDAINGRQ
ncbi:TPA: TA system toxin CbtA family protein [Raoultella planticola]